MHYFIRLLVKKYFIFTGIDNFKSSKNQLTLIFTTNTLFCITLLDKFKAITKITDIFHV